MKIKNIEISSAGSFVNNTTHILCYNKRAFSDPELRKKLSNFSEDIFETLQGKLTVNILPTIVNIFHGSEFLEGSIIKVNNPGEVEYNNHKSDGAWILSSYGVDTFIFLQQDRRSKYGYIRPFPGAQPGWTEIGTYSDSFDPIGFVELDNSVGDEKKDPESITEIVHIDFTEVLSEVNSDHDENNNVDDIYLVESGEGDSDRLKKYYETVDSFEEALSKKPIDSNYKSFLTDGIYDNVTDSLIIKSDGLGLTGYKLDLLREVTVPSDIISRFNKFRVGIFKGEVALYAYNEQQGSAENPRYKIISLQSNLSESFGNSTSGAVKYLMEDSVKGKGYSSIISPNGSLSPRANLSIEWAGNYAVIFSPETKKRYLFDARLNVRESDVSNADQPWVMKFIPIEGEYDYYMMDGGTLIPYEGDKGVPMKEFPTLNFILDRELGQGDIIKVPRTNIIYRNDDFLIDELDYSCKVETLWKDKWKSSNLVTKFNPGFSKLFGNIPTCLSSRLINPVRRMGSWYVFENTSRDLNFIINRTMCICIKAGEYEPIAINDKCMLFKNAETKTYYIYKKSGFWCSAGVESIVNQPTYLPIAYGERFEVGGYSDRIRLNSLAGNKFLFASTGFERFRRNRLPDYPGRIEIIGAINGLIYYKDSNKISYL